MRLHLLLPLLLLASCRMAEPTPPSPRPHDEPTLYGSHVHGYPDLPITVTKTDGSRPFTGTVAGITPTGGTHLATKAYVDSVASGASATMKVKVSGTDTTEDYLNPTLVVGGSLTKTVVSGGANETLRLDATFGTTSGTVCEGDDSRLTDDRDPTGSAGGDLTGTYPNPTLAVDRVPKSAYSAKGVILGGTGSGTYSSVTVGTNGYTIVADSTAGPGWKWASFASVAGTTLLDGDGHTDTLAGTVVRGDLIVGNSTPKWSRFAKGTSYQQFRMNSGGTDPEWATPPSYPTVQFTRTNPAASQTASPVGNAGATEVFLVMIGSGTLTGISWNFTGTHTTGTITLRCRKNGTVDTALVYGPSGASDVYGYAAGTGFTFVAGDRISVEMDTSGTWDGTTGTLQVTPWIRMN